MKKILGLTLGVIMLSSVAMAQDTKPVVSNDTPAPSVSEKMDSVKGGDMAPVNKAMFEERMQERKTEMAKRLKLTKEQQNKADEIHQNSKDEMKQIMDEMKALRQKADTVREKSRKEFEKLLTVEQKQILAEINKERMGKRKDRKPPRGKFSRSHRKGEGAPHSLPTDKK